LYNFKNRIVFENRSGIIEQIQILILIQIPQDHVVIVFVLHMLVFHLIVVACRNGNQTVKHLDNKQCGEKATVLFKIEKHALPGDGQTSFQILK
jgi:hypothetical protein